MCGRFTLWAPIESLLDLFELLSAPQLVPRFNICPSQPVAVVRGGGEGRRLELLRWGLVPAWARDPVVGYRMINARAESASEKPAFREPFRRRRCLIVADGFYEWKKGPEGKQPYYIRMKGGGPFGFAGLWERWSRAGHEPIESCTVITTQPNQLVRDLHDRMPAILPSEAFGPWLDPAVDDVHRLRDLLQPAPAEAMEAYPVSRRVNDVARDDGDCIAPLPLLRDPPRPATGSLFPE